jgi:hypothetical protein
MGKRHSCCVAYTIISSGGTANFRLTLPIQVSVVDAQCVRTDVTIPSVDYQRPYYADFFHGGISTEETRTKADASHDQACMTFHNPGPVTGDAQGFYFE